MLAYCQHNGMGNIALAWDPKKARTNITKQGVSFPEAQTAFLDENARLPDDPDHSEDEERFVLPGYSFQAWCLIVNHCYLHSDTVIRLISARRATPIEEADYWRLRCRLVQGR